MVAARQATASRDGTPRARALIVTGEAGLVLALLAVWLLVAEVRTSGSMAVLFFYSFPSEFLIGLVPHEPVLLYYGEHHPALTVALVAGISTALAEGLNYSFLGFFDSVGWFDRMRRKPVAIRIKRMFHRAPFLAILVAGFTPVPFFPIRFLVVMEGYPVAKYMLGVLVSRTPRFFLLAAFGRIMDIPIWALLLLFAGLIVVLYLPLVRREQAAAPVGVLSGPAGLEGLQ